MGRHIRDSFVLVILCSLLVACGGGGGGGGTTPSTNLLEGAIYPPSSPRNKTIIIYFTPDNISLDIEAIEGQVMVLFDINLGDEAARNVVSSYSGKIIGAIPIIRYYLVEVQIGAEMVFIDNIRKNASVVFAFPNDILTPSVTTVLPNEWNTYNKADNINMNWHLWEIRAPYAWGLVQKINTTSLEFMKIGINEDNFKGLDLGKPDFQGRMDNDPAGIYFGDAHGTWISSMAAASGNNNFGNVGVNWWSNLIFADSPSDDRFTNFIFFGFLVDHGAKVINFSFESIPPPNLGKINVFRQLKRGKNYLILYFIERFCRLI